MARAAKVVAPAAFAGLGAYFCYDAATMKGLRKLQGWTLRDSCTRLLNATFPGTHAMSL